ncbi:hypothetical protein LINGRAHAP2_LOCUS3712 [Linum grandiflorum]
MTRRLKNRERQRRYRARKRLEADKGRSSVANIQSDPAKLDVGKGHRSSKYETRVHCTRKWKKEARRTSVHLAGDELGKKPSLGRRNWKAEARKKKSQLS